MRIRRIEEERGEIDQGVMLKSVSIGAGFGIVLGGVIGCALEGSRTRSIHGTSDTALEGALAGTGVGALMGVAAGCSAQQPAGVDVDGLPRYMRRDLIEQFLRERQEGGDGVRFPSFGFHTSGSCLLRLKLDTPIKTRSSSSVPPVVASACGSSERPD